MQRQMLIFYGNIFKTFSDVIFNYFFVFCFWYIELENHHTLDMLLLVRIQMIQLYGIQVYCIVCMVMILCRIQKL